MGLYLKFKHEINAENLSKSFFFGFLFTQLISFVLIVFSAFRFKLNGAIFIFFSLLSISLSNPWLSDFNFSSFINILPSAIGDGYLPMFYQPRGAVGYLLIPFVLSLVYKDDKMLLFLLVLSMGVHFGYSIIMTILGVFSKIISTFFEEKKKNNLFLLTLILLFQIFFLIYTNIADTSSIISLHLQDLSKLIENFEVNLEILFFFTTVIFIGVYKNKGPERRLSIILLIVFSMLGFIKILSESGIV